MQSAVTSRAKYDKKLTCSRVWRVLFALMAMDTQLPENFPLISKLKGEANNLGLLEAFLESAPQLILQLSIILRTGVMSIEMFFCTTLYHHFLPL